MAMSKCVKTPVNGWTFITAAAAVLAAVVVMVTLPSFHEMHANCSIVRLWSMPVAGRNSWHSRSESSLLPSPELGDHANRLPDSKSAFAPAGQGWG